MPYSVMVARQTLTLLVEVQILIGQQEMSNLKKNKCYILLKRHKNNKGE